MAHIFITPGIGHQKVKMLKIFPETNKTIPKNPFIDTIFKLDSVFFDRQYQQSILLLCCLIIY
jgi:hypothetical protein